jgi:hypothetical protein
MKFGLTYYLPEPIFLLKYFSKILGKFSSIKANIGKAENQLIAHTGQTIEKSGGNIH